MAEPNCKRDLYLSLEVLVYKKCPASFFIAISSIVD